MVGGRWVHNAAALGLRSERGSPRSEASPYNQLVATRTMLPVHAAPTCSVAGAAEIVGSKWTVLIVHDLSEGPRRFTELERSCAGISPRTLAERLRWLEAEEIVERQSYPESPPRVEYALTQKGHALLPVVHEMRRFGHDWLGCGVHDSAVADLTKRDDWRLNREWTAVTRETTADGREVSHAAVGSLEIFRLCFPPSFSHGTIDPRSGYVAFVLEVRCTRASDTRPPRSRAAASCRFRPARRTRARSHAAAARC